MRRSRMSQEAGSRRGATRRFRVQGFVLLLKRGRFPFPDSYTIAIVLLDRAEEGWSRAKAGSEAHGLLKSIELTKAGRAGYLVGCAVSRLPPKQSCQTS